MDHKIIFTGSAGVGKTTAIGCVSDIPAVCTDVRNTDASLHKAMTTAGLDYGEIGLAGGDVLRLYGTPGQARFQFMWAILSKGALGLVILIDNSRDDPLADLDTYLEGFSELIARSACVVGVGRTQQHPTPPLTEFALRLAHRRILCPVIPVDVRQRDEVVQLLELLMFHLEGRLVPHALAQG